MEHSYDMMYHQYLDNTVTGVVCYDSVIIMNQK